jgi:hypothetical protein
LRIEKDEVQGLDSLMAIGAAFGMELREFVQTFRIAEAKPLRSLVIRRAEDLRIAFNRAHHSALYRTMLLPLRTDLEERAEELLETIFSDIQYLSPDESDLMRSWVQSAKEPLEELHAIGMEIFSVQTAARGLLVSRVIRSCWRTGRRATTCLFWNIAASPPRTAFIASGDAGSFRRRTPQA